MGTAVIWHYSTAHTSSKEGSAPIPEGPLAAFRHAIIALDVLVGSGATMGVGDDRRIGAEGLGGFGG